MLISTMLVGFSIVFLPLAIRDGRSHNRMIYMLICGVLLLLAYIRHPFVGADAKNNYIAFGAIQKGVLLNYGKGYLLYVKLIQMITDNYRFFLIVTSTFILAPFFYILRNFKYRCFGIILFLFSVYTDSFSILKGYLALSSALLSAYIFWEEKNKWIAVLLAMAAFLFHPSIILYLGLLWMSAREIKRIYWVMMYAVGGFLWIPEFQNLMSNIVIYIGGKISSKYSQIPISNYFSMTWVLLYGFASALLYIQYQNLEESHPNRKMLNMIVNMHMFGQWMALFGGFIPQTSRYLKFMLIFSIMLICECVQYSKRQSDKYIVATLAGGGIYGFCFLEQWWSVLLHWRFIMAEARFGFGKN